MIDASELPSDVRVALLTTDVSHHLHAAMGAGHDATAAHVRHTQLSDPVDPALEDADGSMVVVELVAIQVSQCLEREECAGNTTPHWGVGHGSEAQGKIKCLMQTWHPKVRVSAPPCDLTTRLIMPQLLVPFPIRLRSTPQKAAGALEKPLSPLLSLSLASSWDTAQGRFPWKL
jgi:hypothetical protein